MFIGAASYREALATAALRLAIGVVELESLVEPFTHEIELSAREIGQEFRCDQQRHAEALELAVLRLSTVGKFDRIRESRAPRGTYAEPQPDSGPAFIDGLPHPASSAFRQLDCHWCLRYRP